MFSLPSFLGGWELPALSSYTSLSSTLQKRIFSFVLRRLLGRYVKEGQLDWNQIDAGITGGTLEITNVELDPNAINQLMGDLPLQATSLIVGSITIQLPLTNLRSGGITITLKGTKLRLAPAQSTARQRPAARHSAPEAGSESLADLAESLLHEDVEDRQLEQSIQQSIVAESEDQSVPGTAAPSDAQAGGFVAAIIEGLLARLSVSVLDTSAILDYAPAAPQLGKVVLELVVGKVDLQSETTEDAASQDDEVPQRRKTRTLEISGVTLWSQCDARRKPASPTSPSSSSASSEDDDADDPDDMMRMSQAVQDLSMSTVSAVSHYSDAASGPGSIYESATLPPPAAAARDDGARHRILSFGDEPIRVDMTTQRPVLVSQPGAAPKSYVRSIDLSVKVGTLAVLLQPNDVCGILSLVNELSCLAEGPEQSPPSTTSSNQSPHVALTARLSLGAAHILCAYQLASSSSSAAHASALDSFWSRPSRTQPPLDHLRLNVFSLLATFSQAPGPKPESSLDLSIGDIDLTERCTQEGTAVTLPILIFEPALTAEAPSSLVDWLQIARESSRTSHPYTRTTFGERAWRLKSRHRRGSSKAESTTSTETGGQEQSKQPCVSVRSDFSSSRPPSHTVQLTALQIFADLSIVGRLMPFLHSLGSVHSARSPAPSTMGGSSLMASVQTLHAETVRGEDVKQSGPVASLEVHCDLIRTHLRVPSKPDERAVSTSAATLRSGLLAVDIQDLRFKSGRVEVAAPVGPRVHYSETARQKVSSSEASARHIAVHFHPSAGSASVSTIANIGQLGGEDESATPRLRPRVQLPDESPGARKVMRVSVPLCTANISKSTLDGLALLADDAATWSADLSRIGESSRDEQDGLRILGSRFFGSRTGLSSLSMSSDSIATVQEQVPKSSALSLDVTEAEVALLVPTQGKVSESVTALRQLDVKGRELRVFFDPSHDKDTTAIDVSLVTLLVKERDANLPLIAPTLEQSLSRGVTPVLSLSMVLFADSQSSHRESRVEPLLRDVTLSVTEDLSLFSDLAAFFKSPAGAFENVEPNELTRLTAKLKNVSLHLSPTTTPARAVFLLGDAQLRSRLVGDSPRSSYSIALAETTLLVVDEVPKAPEDRRLRIKRPLDYWVAQGFARVLRIDDLQTSVTTSRLTLPDVDVKVTKVRAELFACADTALAFEPLAAAFASSKTQAAGEGEGAGEDESASGDWSESVDDGEKTSAETTNILDSLDEDAFRGKRLPTTSSIPDMLDDDIPSHPAYYGHEAAPPATQYVETPLSEDDFFGTESVASMVDPAAAPTSSHSQSGKRREAPVLFSTDIVTVRLLDPAGLRPTPAYFSRPDLSPKSRHPSDGLASTLRVRVSDCDISLRLHGGYDWLATRTEIEEEIKRVRRRLQKIKQLLDEGQKPDDSIEEATQGLMESIHISAPFDPRAADAGQALGALNAELEDQSETASSTSTWQPMPRGQRSGSGVAAGGSGAFATARSKRKSKLERSHHSQIDIELRGFALEYDAFAEGSPLASNLDASAASVQILDNLKTSTWHAFLTEAKTNKHPESALRGSKMVRVQVLELPSSLDKRRTAHHQQSGPPTELRVRAKLSPLRLHVDQDALDFLKKFFTFERRTGHARPSASPSPPAPALPFIQYAEVLPIHLTLDYKPKRVDYDLLLRRGKAIEMMNFFHFDAASMTLRHVKLRGLAGWPRLFDTLNDIWTPDVKANQLADVLAGIAPLRSVVNVAGGVADLVLLPIEQWQKDGRVGKGLKRGARRFAKATALEAVRLGARLATGTQVILERAEHVLGGRIEGGDVNAVPASGLKREVRRWRRRSSSASSDEDDDSDYGEGLVSTIIDPSAAPSPSSQPPLSKYASPPTSMTQALSQAYTGLQRGVSSAAQTILAVPMEVYESGHPEEGGGGGRTVVRAVPIAVLQGARGASEAVSRTMMGLVGALEGGQELGVGVTPAARAQQQQQQQQGEGSSSRRRDETQGRAGKYKQRQL